MCIRDSEFTDAYANLGIAYKDLGLIDEAKQNLEKALALNPVHVEGLKLHNELFASS